MFLANPPQQLVNTKKPNQPTKKKPQPTALGCICLDLLQRTHQRWLEGFETQEKASFDKISKRMNKMKEVVTTEESWTKWEGMYVYIYMCVYICIYKHTPPFCSCQRIPAGLCLISGLVSHLLLLRDPLVSLNCRFPLPCNLTAPPASHRCCLVISGTLCNKCQQCKKSSHMLFLLWLCLNILCITATQKEAENTR